MMRSMDTQEFKSLPTFQAKYLSLLATFIEPDGVFVNDGSFAVPYENTGVKNETIA